ncbi:TetR family transcriptional regulator [Burkholderia pseudomallei]
MHLNHHDVFRTLAEAEARERHATEVFFDAWKHGVELAGVRLFGQGTRDAFDIALTKWELCPNVRLIKAAIGPMSSGEKVFLAAMVSFYDAHDGGALLRRVGVQGLSDLGGLDAQRREVIASLLLHYAGW